MILLLSILSKGLYKLFDKTALDVSLMSCGADIIAIHRNFFMRHASANLLAKLSWMVSRKLLLFLLVKDKCKCYTRLETVFFILQNPEVPTHQEAGETLEILNTWNLYKTSLINEISSKERCNSSNVRTVEVLKNGSGKLNRSSAKQRNLVDLVTSPDWQQPRRPDKMKSSKSYRSHKTNPNIVVDLPLSVLEF